MNEKTTKVSRFYDMWDVEPKDSTIEEFKNNVCGTKLKAKTEKYRLLLKEGKLEEAAKLKKKFPGVTMAGVCQGGRADENLTLFSQRAMFDFDDTNERTELIKSLLSNSPYTELVWTSVSDAGVKVTMLINVSNVQEYVAAYAVVAAELARLVGHPCDGACKNPARLCTEVYDPEIYYNPNAEFFPWEEEGKKLMQKAGKPVGTAHEVPVAILRPQGEGAGLLRDFLEKFMARHPFVAGSRHESMLKLGHAARVKNLSLEELVTLTQMAVARLVEKNFPSSEIESCIRSGYQYISSKPSLQDRFAYSQKVHGSAMNPNFHPLTQEEQEELAEKSNELRASTPHFPEEIYSLLPDILKRGTALARGEREKDMLLMGMIAHLSACLPDVFFSYDQRELSPHIFFAAVSHAGTSKGVVTLTMHLSQAIHDYYANQDAEEQKAYEERLRVWEESCEDQRKRHKKMNPGPKPEPPVLTCFMIPANSSKARLYTHLRDNSDLGGIIHASEINTLAAAMGQDYGKQDDVLCAAYHHEGVSSSFKVDGAIISIRSPRLAMCLTGTPDQLVALVRSQENGLYSRLSLLTAETQWVWRSAAPHKDGVEYGAFFEGLGKEVLHYHQKMKGRRTWVSLTDEQWKLHTAFFERWLRGVAVEGEDSPGAVVLRCGLLAMRLAAVFTALRKCEDELWAAGERICTDDDFHVAMQMTEVMMEHSLLLSSSLPELALKALPLREFHRFLPVLKQMSEVFTFTDFVNETVKQGMSESTGKRMLKKAEETMFVTREGVKYRKLPVAGGEMGS